MLGIIPIDKIDFAPWNYKEEHLPTQTALTANIKRVGQVEIVQVRQKGDGRWEMTNGNHRLTSMLELGTTHVIAFDHGQISAEEAQRITIETHIKFESDVTKLAALTADLVDKYGMEELLKTMPFSEADFDRLLKTTSIKINPDPGPTNPGPTKEPGDDEKGGEEIHALAFDLGEDEMALWHGALSTAGVSAVELFESIIEANE